MAVAAAMGAETAGKMENETGGRMDKGSCKPGDEAGRKSEERSRKTKEEKRQEAEERNRISRATSALKRDLTATEERIALLEAKKKEAEGVLCEPDIYRDPDRIRQLNQELTAVSAELEDLYYGWNDLSLRLEALEESLRG
jgi:chromosome segregation ATPase